MKRVVFLLFVSVFLMTYCKNESHEKQQIKSQTSTYSNPILQGFYPDPSICKVNGDFYMVNSTFAYFPGIPIFKSSDLVNWKQIGNVLDRPEQLNLDGLDVSSGIFAPAINYHKGLYYLVCTLVGGENNFVVTAKNPEGPWSNPNWIPELSGIDPSLFFDKDGKSYIVYNSESPDNKPEYDGHRTIKIYEFDLETLKVVGSAQIVINKGAKPEDKPIWIEGPHIYQENGYYYLMAAEGGTSDEHSEVVFRSKNVKGPYVSYKDNPILTQRHLDANRENPVTSTGHADIIKDNNGNWWGVFLGCRPYDNEGHFNTGRETFMVPVKWKNDWPIFDLEGDIVKDNYKISLAKLATKTTSRNVDFKDEFNSNSLAFDWIFLRTPKEKWYSILNGELKIYTRPETTSGASNPSFIGYRQKHLFGNVTTNLTFKPVSENEKAGLIAFQNEKHYYYLCKSLKDNKPVIQLLKSKEDTLELLIEKPLQLNTSIKLKIEAKGATYSFLFAEGENNWQLLKDTVDARFLSTKVAGGFVGTIYGMYSTSLGVTSENTAEYDWFETENLNKL
ncbi:glycoside hydrolase family 43 protein [Cellulophaga sp. Z1A5H]|uniref:glycoside hydrolase family 43 protein n=1 Tax=Cellulophaga sp. Z1A5H TaxID=2687291 RepID=UPI0013FDFE03|nr:glycoside hydrolase family 43 protein [Cellulophaga sp. Z1A5H]